jgi:hypothetical protein
MAQSHVKIHDTKLVRDINSKALLNTDKAGLEEYLMKREIAKKQQTEQSETKMRLSKIEEEMNEIKQLLRDIASIKANHGN